LDKKLDSILEAQKLKNFPILTSVSSGEQKRYDMHDIALGEFSRKEQTEFFNEAYGDILFEYFKAWLQTEYDDKGQRDYLYNCAMALGSVRGKLAQMSTLAGNIAYVNSQKEDNIEESI
jgi:hypothetical protein